VTTERWLPVVGYEGWYEVSDLGRVRRIKPEKATKPGRFLTPYTNKHGYVMHGLSKEGKLQQIQLHRLILTAFIGPRPEGYQARHLNGDKLDNRLENLAWGTPAENQRDVDTHGRRRRGEQHPNSKLTREQAEYILASSDPPRVLAARFGVGRGLIHDIRRGRVWRWLRDELCA
jgi:hypothetical protein